MKELNFKIVAVLLIYSALVSFFPGPNRLALYVALPLALILSLRVSTIGNWVYRSYSGLFIGLYVWIGITSLYAEYPEEASQQMHEILGVLLLMFVIFKQTTSNSKLIWLYSVYFFFYIGMWYYAKTNILNTIVFGMQRVDDDQLNANTIAYYTFYVTFAAFIISEIIERKHLKQIFRVLFILTIPLSFFVAIATASRQVLIVQIPLLALLLYIRYIKSASTKIRFLFLTGFIVVLGFSLGYIIETYENSYLFQRTQDESIEDDPRTHLLRDAFQVGMDHFFTGVGAGNYVRYSYSRHFSHCTYTELFANTGILGFILYATIVLRFVKKQFSRFITFKDDMFLIFGVFGLIFILDNFFYVFYNSIWLMGFFVLVISHSELYYYKNIKLINTD